MFRSALRLNVLFMIVMPAAPVSALVPPVEVHELRCDNGFSCPEAIRRRVDFWIKVFRSWTTEQVVFHDPRHAERVFSVISAPEGCGRRGGTPEVERERARVRDVLLRIADLQDGGAGEYSEEELALLSLFPDKDSNELRRAAGEVRCQSGNRDRFATALMRYGQYRAQITKTLREHGLSEDIRFLPFVESAYNPRALSRVGAAGLWQIMPATARKLGLQLNAAVDERYDPQRSTQAAARYLRNSGDNLFDAARAIRPDIDIEAEQLNPFIITSYNYGIAGTARALDQVGPDYVALLRDYEAGGFGNAVKNFYASFLAARHVARFADLYFEEIAESRPARTVTVPLRTATSVADARRLFEMGTDELRDLNPSLTNNVWRGVRKIPAGYRLQLPARRGGWNEQVANIETLPELPVRGQKPAGTSRAVETNEVPGGAPAREPEAPRLDQDAGAAMTERVLREIKRSARLEVRDGRYALRVQPEETLGHYADWLGIGSVQEIRKRNKLRDANNVVLGARIVLPVGGTEQQRAFEERRIEYHRALLEQLAERYDVLRIESYKIRRKGMSFGAIAQEVDAPVWLLVRLNPRGAQLGPGTTLDVPVLRARGEKPAGWRMSR